MLFDQDSSDNPEDNPPEESSRLPRSNETDLFREAAVRLYNQLESIRKNLYKEIMQKNPILFDKSLGKKWGLALFGEESVDPEILEKTEEGFVDITYWTDQGGTHPDPNLLKLQVEKRDVVGITIWNIIPIIKGDFSSAVTQSDHPYTVSLQCDETPEESALFYRFRISPQGEWVKEREVEYGEPELTQKSAELTPYDIEMLALLSPY